MSDPKNSPQDQSQHHVDLEHLQQEVNTEASPMFDFLVRHVKVIIGVALAAVAAAAIYAGVSAWSSYSEDQAEEELAQVLAVSGEERIQTLRDYVAKAPESVRGGALFELAGALMVTERFDEAAEIWAELEAEGRPEMRTLSRMGAARCLLLAGKAEEALAKARALLPEAPEALKAPANRLLAACAEAAGENAAAADALQAVLDSGQVQDAPLLTYRIQTLRGEQ